MIDHISVGVSDLDPSVTFYEATLAALGLASSRDRARLASARPIRNSGSICARACRPWPPRAACTSACGRGRRARSMRFTPKRCPPAAHPPAPSTRPHDRVRYYAAFVVDPDGNRIETGTFPAEQS